MSVADAVPIAEVAKLISGFFRYQRARLSFNIRTDNANSGSSTMGTVTGPIAMGILRETLQSPIWVTHLQMHIESRTDIVNGGSIFGIQFAEEAYSFIAEAGDEVRQCDTPHLHFHSCPPTLLAVAGTVLTHSLCCYLQVANDVDGLNAYTRPLVEHLLVLSDSYLKQSYAPSSVLRPIINSIPKDGAAGVSVREKMRLDNPALHFSLVSFGGPNRLGGRKSDDEPPHVTVMRNAGFTVVCTSIPRPGTPSGKTDRWEAYAAPLQGGQCVNGGIGLFDHAGPAHLPLGPGRRRDELSLGTTVKLPWGQPCLLPVTAPKQSLKEATNALRDGRAAIPPWLTTGEFAEQLPKGKAPKTIKQEQSEKSLPQEKPKPKLPPKSKKAVSKAKGQDEDEGGGGDDDDKKITLTHVDDLDASSWAKVGSHYVRFSTALTTGQYFSARVTEAVQKTVHGGRTTITGTANDGQPPLCLAPLGQSTTLGTFFAVWHSAEELRFGGKDAGPQSSTGRHDFGDGLFANIVPSPGISACDMQKLVMTDGELYKAKSDNFRVATGEGRKAFQTRGGLTSSNAKGNNVLFRTPTKEGAPNEPMDAADVANAWRRLEKTKSIPLPEPAAFTAKLNMPKLAAAKQAVFSVSRQLDGELAKAEPLSHSAAQHATRKVDFEMGQSPLEVLRALSAKGKLVDQPELDDLPPPRLSDLSAQQRAEIFVKLFRDHDPKAAVWVANVNGDATISFWPRVPGLLDVPIHGFTINMALLTLNADGKSFSYNFASASPTSPACQ